MSRTNVAPESPENRFLAELATGVPKVQKCRACSRRFFYPRTHCTHCHGGLYDWVDMDPSGRLYAYSNLPASGDRPPYNVVLVDMADGFRMMSTCPGLSVDMTSIGMELIATVDTGMQPPRIVFREKS